MASSQGWRRYQDFCPSPFRRPPRDRARRSRAALSTEPSMNLRLPLALRLSRPDELFYELTTTNYERTRNGTSVAPLDGRWPSERGCAETAPRCAEEAGG